MNTTGFATFETPIGYCGIAWRGRYVAGFQLPEGGGRATRARLRMRFPAFGEAAPPPFVRRAIEAVAALLGGERRDLSAVPLDFDGVPPFHRRVYESTRSIPPGTTSTYGEIAARIGAPGSARAVGQALGRNPFAILVPCHRVLAAGGRPGGFTADGGIDTKLRLLAIEGAATAAQRGLFDGDGPLGFDPHAAVEHLRAADARLARVIERVGPLRLEINQTPSVFAALVEAIVYQQLTAKAAATIHGRLRALFPRSAASPTAGHILAASEEMLRGAGLSRPKILALKDLARRADAGEIPSLARIRRMTDEEIVERLTPVRGVGRWTVEMLLIFRLGRADILPLDDYGIRKGFARAFGKRELPQRDEIVRRGARWAPFRTAASWYLWRATELDPRELR